MALYTANINKKKKFESNSIANIQNNKKYQLK